jgi:hypothetical protein
MLCWSSFILLCNTFIVNSLLTIDPCKDQLCPHGEISCIELVPGGSNGYRYQCHCAQFCKYPGIIDEKYISTNDNQRDNHEFIFSSNFMNSHGNIQHPTDLNSMNLHPLPQIINRPNVVIPVAQQGGSACQSTTCLNGGTCMTNNYPIVTTTTTTTVSTPLCVSLKKNYSNNLKFQFKRRI